MVRGVAPCRWDVPSGGGACWRGRDRGLACVWVSFLFGAGSCAVERCGHAFGFPDRHGPVGVGVSVPWPFAWPVPVGWVVAVGVWWWFENWIVDASETPRLGPVLAWGRGGFVVDFDRTSVVCLLLLFVRSFVIMFCVLMCRLDVCDGRRPAFPSLLGVGVRGWLVWARGGCLGRQDR